MRWMIVSMRINGKCESFNKSFLVIRKESKCHGMDCTNQSCWTCHSRLILVEVCRKATLHVVVITEGITGNAVSPLRLNMNNRNPENENCSTKRKARLIKNRKCRSSWYKHWWGVADHQSAICHYVVTNFSWWCLRRLLTKESCIATTQHR